VDTGGKKKAAAIHEEVTREIDQWLHVLFNGRRKTGYVDLEAVEMMMRSAMHHAGAAGITELLQFPVAPEEQRRLPGRRQQSRQGGRHSGHLLHRFGRSEPIDSRRHARAGSPPCHTP